MYLSKEDMTTTVIISGRAARENGGWGTSSLLLSGVSLPIYLNPLRKCLTMVRELSFDVNRQIKVFSHGNLSIQGVVMKISPGQSTFAGSCANSQGHGEILYEFPCYGH